MLQQELKNFSSSRLAHLQNYLRDYPEVRDLLSRAIVEHPPLTIREGGVIARGYDAELDELLSISEHAGDYLLALEEREKKRTGF